MNDLGHCKLCKLFFLIFFMKSCYIHVEGHYFLCINLTSIQYYGFYYCIINILLWSLLCGGLLWPRFEDSGVRIFHVTEISFNLNPIIFIFSFSLLWSRFDTPERYFQPFYSLVTNSSANFIKL